MLEFFVVGGVLVIVTLVCLLIFLSAEIPPYAVLATEITGSTSFELLTGQCHSSFHQSLSPCRAEQATGTASVALRRLGTSDTLDYVDWGHRMSLG